MPLIAPYGIEAVFEYNGLRMNENKRTGGAFYRISEFGGMDDPDIRVNAEPNPSRDGENAPLALLSGRTVTLNGRIVARNLDEMRQMRNSIKLAFRNPNTELPLFLRAESSAFDHFINCRKRSLQIKESQDNLQFWRDFQVSLRASDPRFLTVATTSTVVQGSTVISNLGTYREYPVITILPQVATSLVNPTITNTTTGAAMTITGTLTNPRTWIIDVLNRTVKSDLGLTIMGQVTPGANMWTALETGNNSCVLTAGSGMAGIAKATFVWRHAWI